MNLEKLCKEVCALTAEVGQFILSEGKKFDWAHMQKKSANEMVSYVDEEAEKLLVKGLSTLLPEAGFITEEGTIEKENHDLCWIIDPLDGTTNFMHQLPLFAISIGLKHKGKIVIGVVHELNRDECFYAWENGGAYMNGSKISISIASSVNESLIVTGFPYSMDDKSKKYMEVIRVFQESSHGVRRLGSAATDMAYVACGRLDAYFEFNVKIWDIAGGICILAEAGGTTTDFAGLSNVDKIKEVEVLAAGKIHSEMLDIIKKIW